MLNLVKAEVYKYTKRAFMYKLIIVLTVIIAVIPSVINIFDIDSISREYIIENLGRSFGFILMLVMVFAVVFLDDYREGTYKNLVVSNISKTEIFLGKFIAQIILAVITMIISIIVLIISLMLVQSNSIKPNVIIDLITRFICSIPIYIAGIAIVDLLAITIKRGIIYIIYYLLIGNIGLIIWIGETFIWKKIGFLKNLMFTNLLKNIESTHASTEALTFAVIGGIVYSIIFISIGILIFNKQEIK